MSNHIGSQFRQQPTQASGSPITATTRRHPRFDQRIPPLRRMDRERVGVRCPGQMRGRLPVFKPPHLHHRINPLNNQPRNHQALQRTERPSHPKNQRNPRFRLLTTRRNSKLQTPTPAPTPPTTPLSIYERGASKRSYASGVCPGWRGACQPTNHHPITATTPSSATNIPPLPLDGRGLG